MSKRTKPQPVIPTSISGKFPILQQKDEIRPHIKIEFTVPKSFDPAGQTLFHVSIPQIIIATQTLIESRNELGSNGNLDTTPSVSVEFGGLGNLSPIIEVINCTSDMILIAATWLQAHVFLLLINDLVARSRQQQQSPQLIVPRIM